MITKGKSLNFLTQDKLNWVFYQINLNVRHKLNDQTPYNLIKRKFEKNSQMLLTLEK